MSKNTVGKIMKTIKKLIVFLVVIALFTGIIPISNGDVNIGNVVQVYASSYSSDYRYWGQGGSDISGIRSYGCWVVAQAKLLYEANVDRSSSFNPDAYYYWESANGYIDSGFYQLNGANAPVAYANQKGKNLTYLGYWDASNTQLWNNINAGYYTILKVLAPEGFNHYVMVANELSKANGVLYVYDSFYSSGTTNPQPLTRYSTIYGGYVYSANNPINSFKYNLDSYSGGKQTVSVRGWAADLNAPNKTLDVHLYIGADGGDNAERHILTANKERKDVNEVFPGAGEYHGFSATVTTSKTGTQPIYLYAVDPSTGAYGKIGSATVTITQTVVPSSVTLDKTTVTLTSKGATTTLKATIAPSDAENKSVTWKSSNTSVATVSSSGVVTAVGSGTATITVTTASGGKTATCKVTVLIPDANGWYYVSSLPSTITSSKYEIQYQNVYVKYATSSPGTGYVDTGVDKTTYVKSGDPWETATNVTTSNTVRLLGYYYYHYCTDGVNADFKQTSVFTHYDSISADSVTEYAVHTDPEDGNYKYYHLKWKNGSDAYCNSSNCGCDGSYGEHGNRSCYWYKMSTYQNYSESILNEYKKTSSWSTTKDANATSVNYRYRLLPTSVTLNKTSATLSSAGATVQLTATVSPSDAGNKTVTWKSSNTAVATVSSTGLVKAVGNGTTTITATTASGGKTATCAVTVSIAPTGVSLDKTSATLTTVGGTVQLNATVSPSTVANKSVTWKSSNTAVATVSSTGLVKAVGNGTATITATTASGGKTATCAVTVSIAPTGVSLDKTSATLTTVGGTVQLNATVSPSTAANKSVTWKSSNTAVATVSSTGLVKAVGNGTATITVTTVSGGKTATCKVSVEMKNGFCKAADGTWCYYVNGKVDTSYTGMAKNDYGWWYVKNGKLDRTYTGLATNNYGIWYMKDGKLDKSVNGLNKVDGKWLFFINGKVNTTYTGLGTNAYGTWYMKDGRIDTTVTGLYKADGKWLYFVKGKLNETYTGLGTNAYGTWYMKDGRIDTTVTGLYKADGKWLYFVNGKLNETYTGLGTNAYGTWYMKDGRIDTTATGLYKVDGKWLYFNKGKLNETYTGLGTNAYGTWYLKNGRINTSFSGTVTIGEKSYTIKNGKVV